MKIQRFEDIEAWKEARKLVKVIYDSFSHLKDYNFRDQIQRAALSIMSNIAEGFDRGTNKEFVHFLVVARGSVSEIKSLIYAATDVGYLDRETLDDISSRCSKITALLNGFIKYLKTSTRQK